MKIIDRIEKYKVAVANYRDAGKKLEQAAQEITVHVDEKEVNTRRGCIKKYLTTLPKTDLYDDGDKVYPETTECHRFHEKPCPAYKCPLNQKNVQYREAQLAFVRARDARKAAFKAIFQRTK